MRDILFPFPDINFDITFDILVMRNFSDVLDV